MNLDRNWTVLLIGGVGEVMILRKASMEDAYEVGRLYDSLCDFLSCGSNYPGWKKDIYPTIDDATAGINEDCLYVAIVEDRIVGTVILHNKPEKAYEMVTWRKELSYEHIYVIYTLTVHPDMIHKGIGSKILELVEEMARKEEILSIRLDVVTTNIPAIKLYEKHGFTLVDTIDLGYREYGLDWFRIYEKNL